MNIALIGTGTISEKIHLPLLKSTQDVKIVGICDNNEARLKRVSKKFNIERTFSNVDEMFESSEIDLLDITTPGYTHFEIAKKAISSGIHLLIEKPATMKAEEAEHIASESKKQNLKIEVCQDYRFKEPVIEFQKRKKRGEIGNIDHINSMVRGSSLFGMPPWFLDEKKSGGILYELSVHAIDLQNYLLGNPKKLESVIINFDEVLNLTTSIIALVEYENGSGILDLRWFGSSNFFHNYVSSSVVDSIIKFNPDGLIIQRSDFSPFNECTGEIKRLWNFGVPALQKKYSQKSQFSHKILLDDLIKSIKTDSKLLVPIKDVVPTIKLMEDIFSKMK